MATILDKELKRQIAVDGADYTVVLDPEGIRLTGKGKRKPEVELRWSELLSGDAAMAAALNASLVGRPPAPPPQVASLGERAAPAARRPAKRARKGG